MTKKKNIIAFSPHADDVEIAMGGTIAKFINEGHNVTIITAILPKENTDGKINNLIPKPIKIRIDMKIILFFLHLSNIEIISLNLRNGFLNVLVSFDISFSTFHFIYNHQKHCLY